MDWSRLEGTVWGGTYLLDRRVGEGGFGVVFRAKHQRQNEVFAIKIMKHLVPPDSEVTEARGVMACVPPAPEYKRREAETVLRTHEMHGRFLREAQVMDRLHQGTPSKRHPNIVFVHGVHCTAEGRPWLVMEWLEGRDLWTGLRFNSMTLSGRRLPWKTAWALLQPVAAAVGLANKMGVAHRDLSPKNVYLTGEGSKVLDFGLASDPNATIALTTTELAGTPLILPPEGVDDPTERGMRGDVWALGVLLYMTVTGRHPLGAPSSPLRMLEAVRRAAIIPIDEGLLPAAVEAVVLRCLQKDPTARYADGTELASNKQSRFTVVWTSAYSGCLGLR